MTDILPAPQQDSVTLEGATTSARPDAHTQRYDRQLRLWASSGQSALETSKLLVVNGTPTATQTLKNLVLPGVGNFTVLDPVQATPADAATNFFLEHSSVGQPRAEQVVKLLSELNPDVKGSTVVQQLSDVLPATLIEYTLIIAVDVPPSDLLPLADLAWQHSIPLIKVKSCGFYGLVRTQIKELPIVETHPESLIDLRIHTPFPELQAYVDTFDYATMDSQQYSHVPAIVILIKALEQWKAENDGKPPSNYEQRKTFTDGIVKMKRSPDDDNFDEAVTYFRRAGDKPPVPAEIQALFSDPACENLTKESPIFWIMLRAVREFVQSNQSTGLLPLSGALPDMKADTSRYVDLQRAYRSKARQDLTDVKQHLDSILLKLGLPQDTIPETYIETFVKHSAFLQVIRGTSLREEWENSKLKGKIEELKMEAGFSEVRDDALNIYIGFQASDLFHLQHNRYPGTDPSDTDGTKDHAELQRFALEYLGKMDGGDMYDELSNVLHEICRAGATDLPQIAALMGGLVAQEAIKIITKQYVPLNGSCIFDGIVSRTGIVKA